MKVLVLGNGAREHALAWKISESPLCEEVYLHPGNGGTLIRGFKSLELTQLTKEGVLKEISKKGILLVVIGPETYLNEGYADFLREKGVAVVGPGAAGARLESSKMFAKEIMEAAEIPTTKWQCLTNERDYHPDHKFPVVLKYDGLAAGKGVVIAKDSSEVSDFFDRVWKKREFGTTGPILLEEYIQGVELSYMALCDGETFVPLATATDYKRVFDNHQGPNTGGMGAISPSPYFTADLERKIRFQIMEPLLHTLREKRIDYRGIIYAGLMIDPSGQLYVLEFNARFGDPETQAVMLRLKSDFVQLLMHTARASLSEALPISWASEIAIYLVAAAENYPASPRIGDVIEGEIEDSPNHRLFFAGVTQKSGRLITSGGRVLGVAALGETLETARANAYAGMERFHFKGRHFRKDIGN